MGDIVTVQDVANIALLIAPGYVAVMTYSVIYAKHSKSFSHLLIESIVFSILIVALVNYIWVEMLNWGAVWNNTWYIIALFLASFLIGVISAKLRLVRPVKWVFAKIGFGFPDEDFIRNQFKSLPKDGVATVTLKSGEVFSGTPSSGATYGKECPREYRFTNIAWFNKANAKWEERPGSLIINLDEVNYLELSS